MNGISCQEKALRERFVTLWESNNEFYNTQTSIEVWQVLDAYYTEPGRHYHNFNHLEHCIQQLDLTQNLIKDPVALELAIIFHDIIYESGALENEQQSANLFTSLAKGGFKQGLANRVVNMILATRHTSTQLNSYDEQLICDIDLSSFALPWNEFVRDSEAIRAEAESVSAHIFYPGKINYLDKMLHRPVIYMTDYFYQRYESLARENIKRYIKQLNKLVDY